MARSYRLSPSGNQGGFGQDYLQSQDPNVHLMAKVGGGGEICLRDSESWTEWRMREADSEVSLSVHHLGTKEGRVFMREVLFMTASQKQEFLPRTLIES